MNKKTEESRIAYNKIASEYDASREGQYTRFHIMELSNTIDLHEGNVVLDVACGNGTLLRELSKKAKIQANGIDISENMICSAKMRWPCVYPSFYGSAPPMSTRITALRVLTSFVPPVHNQGVSSAPLQGHALWNIFLLTTGSFFVISLTDLYVFLGRHPAADVFPAGSHTFQLSCHRWIQLPATSAGGSVQL